MGAFEFSLGAGLVLAVWIVSRSGAERSQMGRLERKVDALLAQAGIQEIWPPASEAVQAEIAAGRKIQAIKEYRQQYPYVGLATAKEAVEDLMRRKAP